MPPQELEGAFIELKRLERLAPQLPTFQQIMRKRAQRRTRAMARARARLTACGWSRLWLGGLVNLGERGGLTHFEGRHNLSISSAYLMFWLVNESFDELLIVLLGLI